MQLVRHSAVPTAPQKANRSRRINPCAEKVRQLGHRLGVISRQPMLISSHPIITQMRIMVLLLVLLALLGGAALAFVAFEVMRPHPTEQVPP